MTKLLLLLCALLAAPAAYAANPHVILHTNMGKITLELYPENAPKTVENFLQYVKEGHYNGTIFHRVIPGFMVQGGGYTPDFKEKPTHPPIRNEAPTGLGNSEGMVAMARSADPHSATSQFFINLVPNRFLDFKSPTTEGYGYCVFARVSDGMDVVHRIAKVATRKGPPPQENVPVKPIIIQRAELVAAAHQPRK